MCFFIIISILFIFNTIISIPDALKKQMLFNKNT